MIGEPQDIFLTGALERIHKSWHANILFFPKEMSRISDIYNCTFMLGPIVGFTERLTM